MIESISKISIGLSAIVAGIWIIYSANKACSVREFALYIISCVITLVSIAFVEIGCILIYFGVIK